MKKLVSLFLALFLLICGFSLSAAEEVAPTPEPERHTCGEYEYIILEDGTAEIAWYSGEEEDVVIPDVLNGIQVTSIGNAVFWSRCSMISVTIPESITNIV